MMKQKTNCGGFSRLLHDRTLVLTALFVTVLCYGFAITHQSIGIDDVARNFYLYGDGSWNMIRQGRLLHVLLNLLTRCVDFIPFFTEYVGAFLFFLSSLLFCWLFQSVCAGKLSSIQLAAFAAVYLSSSVNVEKFLYSLDVIAAMTSYCFCALGLLYAYRFVGGQKWAALPGIVLTMGAIASYESFLFLYICGVFAILMLEILENPEKWRFCALFRAGVQYALVLLAAALLYYGLVAAVQHLTGNLRTTSPYTGWESQGQGFWGTLMGILKGIAAYFRDSLLVSRYRPVWIFCGVTCLGGLSVLWLAIRKKNFWLIPCFLALLGSNFCIHIIYGSFHPRIAQTFCFYVGFLVLLLVGCCRKTRAGTATVLIFAALLVLIQSADMNRWFYNDYARSQKEEFVVHTLATQLQTGYDLSKPVILTNCPNHWSDDSGYLITRLYPGGDVNGNSVIYWCGNTVTGYCPTFTADLFRLYGYDFLVSPTVELAVKAQDMAKGMPIWPSEGSVREFEDFIAVNFG